MVSEKQELFFEIQELFKRGTNIFVICANLV